MAQETKTETLSDLIKELVENKSPYYYENTNEICFRLKAILYTEHYMYNGGDKIWSNSRLMNQDGLVAWLYHFRELLDMRESEGLS